MKKVVRIGRVEDQDSWRREDISKMTPNQRVEHLMDMREMFIPEEKQRLERVASIQRLGR